MRAPTCRLSFSFFRSLFFSVSPAICHYRPEWRGKNRTTEILSVQSVDFTSTFQMCHFLRFFVSFVVAVDVESESMVDNHQFV